MSEEIILATTQSYKTSEIVKSIALIIIGSLVHYGLVSKNEPVLFLIFPFIFYFGAIYMVILAFTKKLKLDSKDLIYQGLREKKYCLNDFKKYGFSQSMSFMGGKSDKVTETITLRLYKKDNSSLDIDLTGFQQDDISQLDSFLKKRFQ